jgi:hypothetical protein
MAAIMAVDGSSGETDAVAATIHKAAAGVVPVDKSGG